MRKQGLAVEDDKSSGVGYPGDGCELANMRLGIAKLPVSVLTQQNQEAVPVSDDEGKLDDVDPLPKPMQAYGSEVKSDINDTRMEEAQAHPSSTETKSKDLCKLIDCQKLSQEASNHAAQNNRLPIKMAVRVLYFQQLCLKSDLSGNSGDGSFSQRMINSSVPSAVVSPKDNYASLRRENHEFKPEISRMRVRLSELEKEQAFMKRGMSDNKSGGHGKAFFESLSRGLGILVV